MSSDHVKLWWCTVTESSSCPSSTLQTWWIHAGSVGLPQLLRHVTQLNLQRFDHKYVNMDLYDDLSALQDYVPYNVL